ncbi:hypothetical protein [Bradyrhizobium canariense]|uniref:hypothetical protein n=1 Tax=Bradyrhizobium canariense TaxID=255045 RepID=UPI00195974FC|nr:hypothetical protein [Bradyrhizobium canariense]MBM7485148.1 hypothetical protein [Bradyrhizobium canariense]
MVAQSTIGFAEMRRILQDNGIKYLKIEFLLDWYRTDEKRMESDKFRQQTARLSPPNLECGISRWARDSKKRMPMWRSAHGGLRKGTLGNDLQRRT